VLEQSSTLVHVNKDNNGKYIVPNVRPTDTSAPVNAVVGSGSDSRGLTEIQFSGSGMKAAKTGIFALEKADLFNILCITPEGNVIPCTCFWGINGENLRDHTFQWIWENSVLLNYFRNIRLNDIKGACRDCKWLLLCHGGCKAENYLNGDIFGSSRSCWVANAMRQTISDSWRCCIITITLVTKKA
jgi:radical SAM protein with 4Fe4S-binding SPASM domain